MNKKNQKVALFILALVTGTIIFFACSNDDENYSVSLKNKVSIANIEVPDKGFMFVNRNQSSNTLSVSTGTSFSNFIRESTVIENSIVDVKNIIYELEDLGTIRVTPNEKLDEFRFIAFEDEFKIFDIKNDKDGAVSYRVTHKDGDTVCSKVYYDGLTAENFASILSSSKTFENPFLSSFKKVDPATLTAIVAVASAVVAAVKVVVDIFSKPCERKLHADEENCKTIGKCIKYKSRCHYECVECPTAK